MKSERRETADIHGARATNARGDLERCAELIRAILETALPSISTSWWEECVKAKLTFQQLQALHDVESVGLSDLDLEVLVRVLDQNWSSIVEGRDWWSGSRHLLNDLLAVDHRWSFSDVKHPSERDEERDLETVHRFLGVFESEISFAQDPEADKQQSLRRPTEDPDGTRHPAGELRNQPIFAPGEIVHLKADPSKIGAVLKATTGLIEPRYDVFVDGKAASFFESQLEKADRDRNATNTLDISAFHARLTALQLLHPSISNLYSLDAARIDYIPYQYRPVLRFIRADRPRLLIADSVGVGKTIEAGLILKELQSRGKVQRVLIICPRPLITEQKWRRELKRFDEDFEALDGPGLRFCISETDLDGEWPDRYAKCIVPFSLLSADLLHGKGKRKGLLDLEPAPHFDLVIVDEAHHIRNTDTQTHQVVRFLCDNSEAVVFLTATPIQLGEHDLFVLLNTLRPDLVIDEGVFSSMTEPNHQITEAARLARKGGSDWADSAQKALSKAAESAWGRAVLQKDPDFQAVFDLLDSADSSEADRIGAIRAIEELHTLSGVMNRTLRRDIGDFTQRKPETVSVPFSPAQKQLHDAVLETQEKIYSALHGGGPVRFFLTTIRRQAASCINGLAPFLRHVLSQKLNAVEWLEISGQTDDSLIDIDIVDEISDSLTKTLKLAEKLDADPSVDPKFQALQKILEGKQCLPNSKVMVFSSFRHSLSYLSKSLLNLGFRVGLIHGDTPDETRITLRNRFEQEKASQEALDVLLFSEVGCEGLDYQFCDCIVNYDLPWNPMRIDQRIGRIDRWGQQSEAVAIYNLITPGTIDAEIYDRCLYRIGVFQRALGANEAILGKITQDMTEVGENLSLSPEERERKLEVLAENSIRLVREQEELESRRTELFGLDVPREQFRLDVEAASSYWLSGEALINLVSRYFSHCLGSNGITLTGKGPKKLLRVARKGRESLFSHFLDLEFSNSPVHREWERWLRGNDPHLEVTFDSRYAAGNRQTVLISPSHPLCRQASQGLSRSAAPYSFTSASVNSKEVPPGEYPFAIHEWQYIGIRNDVKYRAVCLDPGLAERLLRLLPKARDIDSETGSIPSRIQARLEEAHYAMWVDARAEHVAENAHIAAIKRASLESSHAGRMEILRQQLSEAQNDRIRRMRGAQMENAKADYGRQLALIEVGLRRADIISNPIGWGVLRVRV
ncbi:DEAD/DEAH box helicase [Gemmatimonadota bacterium]